MRRKPIIRYQFVTSAVIITTILIVFVWLGQHSDHYRELFGEIQLGMSKAEIVEIVGDPVSIDTTGSAYEIWTFDVPALFARVTRY